jgi:hypothetical protein
MNVISSQELDVAAAQKNVSEAGHDSQAGRARRNRIKEQQLGLFSDRTSCHAWWANPYRLLLSSGRQIRRAVTKLAAS